jgi:hypothetical protein
MNATVLSDCLRRLIPHVDASRIALTGGVAIGLHFDIMLGDRARASTADDIDFVADGVDAVRETVAREFLVSHFHLPQPGYQKFLIQLVDPTARLRLDFFPDARRALCRAPVVDVAGVPLRVVTAQDILDHKLALLSGASVESPIDQKHYADAERLAAVCRRDVPAYADSHLTRTSYSRDIAEKCSRCQISEDRGFPLASKRAILDILGYV